MCLMTVQHQSSFVSLLAATSLVMSDLIFRYHLLSQLSSPFLSSTPRSLLIHLITVDLPFFPSPHEVRRPLPPSFAVLGPGTAGSVGYAPCAPMQNRRREQIPEDNAKAA